MSEHPQFQKERIENNTSPSLKKVGSSISFPQQNWTLKSPNAMIEQFREKNPFDFQVTKYADKFNKVDKDNSSLEKRHYDHQGGKYEGEVKKDTRIQHGRGVFIDTKNGSVYEGWRVRNKREIYGRLIDKHGMVYEGEFRNNVPHGQGQLWQCTEIEGIYPKGLCFNGQFQNDKREEWGILRNPEKQLTYYGYFNNNKMDGTFKVIKDNGDCFLENYILDKQQNPFSKVSAYVFTDKMYGVIPTGLDVAVEQMTKRAFLSVNKLNKQGDKQFYIMDIEFKTPEMLSDFHFASLWLQYQTQNRPNTLLFELLQGKHAKFQPNLNHLLVRIREDFNIEECEKKEREIAQYQMVPVKRVEKKINEETIQFLKADYKVVDEIIRAAVTQLEELTQLQEINKRNIWEKVLNIIIIDETMKEKFLDAICLKKNNEEQSNQQQLMQMNNSNDLSQSQIADQQQQVKVKTPIQKRALEMYRSMKEAQQMSQPIREYYNLSRLIQEQVIKEGKTEKMYQVLKKEDVIQSLLMEQPEDKLFELRQKLGKVFLEMCLSLHFVNKPVENCIEDFMKNKVLDLFIQSGYYQIAISQQLIHNGLSDIDQQVEDQVKYFFDIKNLKHNLTENDIQQELVDQISDKIGCENKSESIVDEALKIIESKIIDPIEQDQDQDFPEKLRAETFFNFLGAIAQLINPSIAVKFMLDILKRVYPLLQLNDENLLKMRKLYKFRKMQEFEKHISYDFKDQTILVQSLTHESYQSHQKQSGLEKAGKNALRFIFLRQLLLNSEDIGLIEKIYNSEIFSTIDPHKLNILATLLRLQSKLIYKKGEFELMSHDYFQDVLQVFQMTTQVDSKDVDDSFMIDTSAAVFIKKFKPGKKTYSQSSEGEKQFSPALNQALFAFIGALSLDSNFNEKTYKSLCTLLPYLFINHEYRDILRQECLALLQEKLSLIPFPDIFRVSKEAFNEKTFSMNDCFDYLGKLFNIFEFDLYNEESYGKLVEYVKKLEYKSKQKLINIFFNEENFNDSNNYVDSSYYIVHSHVISVCLKKEEEMGKTGLFKEFITKMRNSNKQRVINEQEMLIINKEQNSGLTLAQKIKMLINLNSIQYQTNQKEVEKLYNPPGVEEAMNYVNKLNVQKEKTFDSTVYSYKFEESLKGVSDFNPLKPDGQKNLLQQDLLEEFYHITLQYSPEVTHKLKWHYILQGNPVFRHFRATQIR